MCDRHSRGSGAYELAASVFQNFIGDADVWSLNRADMCVIAEALPIKANGHTGPCLQKINSKFRLTFRRLPPRGPKGRVYARPY